MEPLKPQMWSHSQFLRFCARISCTVISKWLRKRKNEKLTEYNFMLDFSIFLGISSLKERGSGLIRD